MSIGAQAAYGQFVNDKDSAHLENSAKGSIWCILWQANFLASVFLCLVSLYPITWQTAESQKEAGCSPPSFFPHWFYLYIVLGLGGGSSTRPRRKAQLSTSKIKGLCNFTRGICTMHTALLAAGMLNHAFISSAPAGSDWHRGNVCGDGVTTQDGALESLVVLSHFETCHASVFSVRTTAWRKGTRGCPQKSQSRNAAAGFHVPVEETENPPESRWGSKWSLIERTRRHEASQVTGISGTSLTLANLMGCFHSICYQHQHSFLRTPLLLFSVFNLLGKK